MSTSSVPALLRPQVDRWAEAWLAAKFSRLLELRAQDPGTSHSTIRRYAMLFSGRHHLAQRVTNVVEHLAPLALGGVAVLYVVGTAGRASQKLLWHDELFTLYLTRLPSVHDVFVTLAAGTDGVPPLFHLFTRLVGSWFGYGLVGIRLPSIAGFLVAVICLYAFVSKRCGPLYGLVASVIPIASDAYIYAYEARPYGMVLGCAGLALISWQSATSGIRRRLALSMLFASVATAMSLHYYAVLLLAPLGAGELVRAWQRRRIDWPVWWTLAATLLALVVHLPLVRAARSVATGLFSRVTPRLVADAYENVLVPLVVPAMFVLVLVAVVQAFVAPESDQVEDDRNPAPPEYEWVAMLTLAALPAVAAALGALVSGAFVPRYALSWILGFSALVSWTISVVSRQPRIVGTIAVTVGLGWVAAKELSSARLLLRQAPTVAESNAALLRHRVETVPIAVTHGHVYLPLAEYAPRDISSRLVMLTQPARMNAQLGYTAGDAPLSDLATWMPLQVQDFDSFIRTHRHFLLYGPPMWMASEIRVAGGHLELRGEDEPRPMFAMSAPECVFLYDVTFQ
jgi:hypothetical protein